MKKPIAYYLGWEAAAGIVRRYGWAEARDTIYAQYPLNWEAPSMSEWHYVKGVFDCLHALA